MSSATLRGTQEQAVPAASLATIIEEGGDSDVSMLGGSRSSRTAPLLRPLGLSAESQAVRGMGGNSQGGFIAGRKQEIGENERWGEGRPDA